MLPNQKEREKFKNCKHMGSKTGKGYGCGSSAFEMGFKCALHGECITHKVCKKPDRVAVCQKCNNFEEK